MKEKVFELNNIVHRYGDKELLNVEELSIFRGEILALLGPNGAGKSTLLRLISLLEEPSEGDIIFHDKDVTAERDRLSLRRKIAMVFQEPLLYRTTVFNNVASGLKFRGGLSRVEIEQRVNRWLDIMGITHLSDRFAHQISGGEAQRASFARALVLEPEVCLLDEPLAGLDHPSRERLQEELQTILRQLDMTTVYVTHDRAEALMLADRVGVMIDGRIVQIGTVEKVFNAPADEEVARFIGVETILAGTVRSQEGGKIVIDVDGQEIQAHSESPLKGNVFLCIRPEDITISTGSKQGQNNSARNRFKGKIKKIVSQGYRQKIILDCGFSLTASITNEAKADLLLGVDKEIVAHFKANHVHLIKRG